MDNNTVAHQTGLVGTMYLTLGNHCTCHGADLRNLIDLTYLNLGSNLLLDNLVEHTLHSGADVVNGIIDNRVGIDFHAVAFSQLSGIGRGTYLEAYDDSIGS